MIFIDLSGSLTQTETTNMIVNNQYVDGEFTHYLNANLASLGIEPTIKYNPFSQIYFNLGINISTLMTKEYDQVERITKPSNLATFIDANGNNTFSRERNKFSGTLEFANSLYIAPILSVSYKLPLNKDKTFNLEPEISYYLGISNIVSDDLVDKWTVDRLNFGIAIKYNPLIKTAKEKIFQKEIKIDTIILENELISSNKIILGKEITEIKNFEEKTSIITTEIITRVDTLYVPKTYKIEGNLSAVGVDENGNEIQNPIFKIEEFVSNRLDPLLNYVFFEENSSELPKRYKKLNPIQTNDFKINDLFRDSTLELYYNMLNIIGSRMKEYPLSKIRLVGCNSDLGVEKGNLLLSENRAIAVKNYLINVWGFDENRIEIQKRNLPEKASTPINEDDKIAENRRVEIYSNEPKILEPIFIEKIDRTANPPIVRFKFSVNSDLPLKNWEIKSYQESFPEKVFMQSGNSSIIPVVEWELSENQKITPSSADYLKSILNLEDEKGNQKTIIGDDLKIDVMSITEKRKQMQGDFEIERFSLILFDFDKASIEANNKSIIDFIKNRINENSEIEILGFADRTGSQEYNQKLTEQRAEATQKSLNRNDASANGVGSTILLYNNDLPEGRFYCRTVNIIVKTKIK